MANLITIFTTTTSLIVLMLHDISALLFNDTSPMSSNDLKPSFIWSSVKFTMELARKEHCVIDRCPTILLYNSPMSKYLEDSENVTSNYVTINIDGESDDDISMDESTNMFLRPEKLEEIRQVMREQTHTGQLLLSPCITVISLVNYSTDPLFNSGEYSVEEEERHQQYKLTLSQQFTAMLQFQTPISRRHLILVRLADQPKELYRCTKKAHFPRRAIPIWEQVLFDYFAEARVIQGLISQGKGHEVKLSKEKVVWQWLCEDAHHILLREEECYANKTEDCVRAQSAGEFAIVGNNTSCPSRLYKARH